MRSSPAFWLETTGGTVVLDFGPSAAHRLAQEKLDWPNLDAIWISHFHLDHCGGLVPFLFSIKWAPQTYTRKKPLRIYGPEGLRRLINALDEANNYRIFDQSCPLEIVEIEANERFDLLAGVKGVTIKTPHTKESLALHLTDHDGKMLVYSSDTGVSEELSSFARNVNLLLLECSFRRNKPVQKHLDLDEAIRLAKRAKPVSLMLTHFYPEWDELDVVNEAQPLWESKIVEATDGLRLEV